MAKPSPGKSSQMGNPYLFDPSTTVASFVLFYPAMKKER